MALGMFDVGRMLQPIKNKIFLLIGRCILKAIDNSDGTQLLQVTGLKGEIISDVERLEDYGFTSYPKADTEALLLFPNGNRDQGIVIKVHDRTNRPTSLASGEVVMWSDAGNKITMKSDGTIAIEGNGGTLEFAVLASLLVSKISSNIVNKYNSHTHAGAGPAPAANAMVVISDTDIQSTKVKTS